MKVDFSRLNLQYLIQARDLALQVPERLPQLLGISKSMAALLARVTPEDLCQIVQITHPLFVPRAEPWWWQRFLRALRGGRQEEVDAVLAHAALVVTGH
jgi:hypothetical protein